MSNPPGRMIDTTGYSLVPTRFMERTQPPGRPMEPSTTYSAALNLIQALTAFPDPLNWVPDPDPDHGNEQAPIARVATNAAHNAATVTRYDFRSVGSVASVHNFGPDEITRYSSGDRGQRPARAGDLQSHQWKGVVEDEVKAVALRYVERDDSGVAGDMDVV